MFNKFKWYRRLRGGIWHALYYPPHYLHGAAVEWTKDQDHYIKMTAFPYCAKLIATEIYPS